MIARHGKQEQEVRRASGVTVAAVTFNDILASCVHRSALFVTGMGSSCYSSHWESQISLLSPRVSTSKLEMSIACMNGWRHRQVSQPKRRIEDPRFPRSRMSVRTLANESASPPLVKMMIGGPSPAFSMASSPMTLLFSCS